MRKLTCHILLDFVLAELAMVISHWQFASAKCSESAKRPKRRSFDRGFDRRRFFLQLLITFHSILLDSTKIKQIQYQPTSPYNTSLPALTCLKFGIKPKMHRNGHSKWPRPIRKQWTCPCQSSLHRLVDMVPLDPLGASSSLAKSRCMTMATSSCFAGAGQYLRIVPCTKPLGSGKALDSVYWQLIPPTST